jgi:DNA-binding transcriptional ArsR family regulator
MKIKDDICEVTFIDKDKISKVKENLPDLMIMNDLSNSFKILGEPTRLRLLLILAESELCVCDLSELLESSISSVSHHLRLLRNHKMVKFRKSGKMVYYSLDNVHIKNIIIEAKEHFI